MHETTSFFFFACVCSFAITLLCSIFNEFEHHRRRRNHAFDTSDNQTNENGTRADSITNSTSASKRQKKTNHLTALSTNLYERTNRSASTPHRRVSSFFLNIYIFLSCTLIIRSRLGVIDIPMSNMHDLEFSVDLFTLYN